MVDALFDHSEEVLEDIISLIFGHAIFEFVTAYQNPSKGIGSLFEVRCVEPTKISIG